MAVREIGASVSLDASTFKKEMSAVNSNLSGLQSEMKAVTAEFAENANGVEALSAKQKILSQQEEQQKVKVDALTKAYEEQAAATGEDSVETDKLRKQLNNARADYAKAHTAAKQNREELQKHGPIYARVGDAASKLGGKVSGAVKDFGHAAESLPVLGDALKGVQIAGKAAGKGLELAGKGAAEGFKLTAKATAALTTAGAAAATAMGTLAVKGLSTLISYAKDAATAVDADGNLVNERFSTLAGNLTRLDAGATAAKTALGTLLLPALESLSGAGADLLEGFSADLAACEGDTEKMGKVAAKYLKEAAKLIKQELPGLVNLGADVLKALVEGVGEAMPELLAVGGELLDMLIDGLVSNADSVGDGAAQIVTQLLTFLLQNAPKLLTAGVQILTSLISGITGNLPDLIPVAIQAIQELLQALVSNAPELLIGGATLILTLVEGLIEHIPDLIAAIPQLIRDFITGFENSPTLNDLAEVGERIMTKIWDGLKAVWESVKGWFSEKVGGIADFLGLDLGGGGSGHAGGLNYVPYDNYPALLHKGEKVLTAAENASGAYGSGGSRTAIINVYPQTMTRAQTEYLIRQADVELGRDA